MPDNSVCPNLWDLAACMEKVRVWNVTPILVRLPSGEEVVIREIEITPEKLVIVLPETSNVKGN